jgi:hypothetical protein
MLYGLKALIKSNLWNIKFYVIKIRYGGHINFFLQSFYRSKHRTIIVFMNIDDHS